MYDTSRFSAFMIKKNNIYFLDCFASRDNIKDACNGKNAATTLFPLHMIFKILSIEKDQIRFTALDPDALKKYTATGKSIKYETLSKDEILLTEKPASLQQKLYNTAAIFGEVTIFNRVK